MKHRAPFSPIGWMPLIDTTYKRTIDKRTEKLTCPFFC